jgi:hypothetical protein
LPTVIPISGPISTGRAAHGFHKLVYGEVELTHRYHYYDSGVLKRAEITMLDEDPVQLDFDETGAQIAGD